jgi:hypothetical protein
VLEDAALAAEHRANWERSREASEPESGQMELTAVPEE